MGKAKELREKRAKLIKEAREILNKAEAEKRGLAPEEDEKWNKLMADVATLETEYTRLERQEKLENDLKLPVNEPIRPDPNDPRRSNVPPVNHRATPEYRAAFASWLRGGPAELGGDERRALQADIDTVGGYLLAPESLVTELIKAVDDQVFIRPLATVFSVPNADSLGAVSLDADPADAAWTSELAIGDEDSTFKLGKRNLHPHPLAKLVKISNTLLRKVGGGPEGLVRDRLGYKFGITQEKTFLTGHGAGQPLGIFTAHADGIPTGRDVSTGNTTTSITTDGLIEAKFTLKGQYWTRARWIFHRDAVKQIAKLKDGEGQYIWRESLRVGEPDRILGFPYHMSEYAPNTFTSAKYVGILGDLSRYWIADALSMSFQRLVELYAATNQVGIIGRLETDGMPVLAEAFVRVKLA